MSDEFFSFDEALNELRLKEEELKRLVSEGEIRAFRKGDTMKLRRSDVESLKTELAGGEVVDLGDATEELVFEDDADLVDEAGMATEELVDVETLIEDDVEDVGELDTIDLDEEYDLEDDEPVTVAPIGRRSAAASADEEEILPVWALAVVFATSAALLLFVPLAIAISTGRASGIAKGIAGMFQVSFGS